MADLFGLARAVMQLPWDPKSPLNDQITSSLMNPAFKRHPYGFLILHCGHYLGADLRIHVWLSEKRKRQVPDWPPHTHPGQLISLVVRGCVRNRIWNVTADASGSHCVYEVRYVKDESVLLKTNDFVFVSSGEETTIHAGAAYEIHKGVFHDSDADPKETAVTLVWMQKDVGGRSTVIGERNGPGEVRFARSGVSSMEAFAATREINEAFGF